MRILAVAGLAGLIGLAGCHSPYVEADVINATAAPVTLVEVDYPSASFGVSVLAAGATYHYRFKILGSGATKLQWSDAGNHDHIVAGPELHEGQQGTLKVTIGDGTARWSAAMRP